jgi:hypothetical protein
MQCGQYYTTGTWCAQYNVSTRNKWLQECPCIQYHCLSSLFHQKTAIMECVKYCETLAQGTHRWYRPAKSLCLFARLGQRLSYSALPPLASGAHPQFEIVITLHRSTCYASLLRVNRG